jgi:hypothetical protein
LIRSIIAYYQKKYTETYHVRPGWGAKEHELVKRDLTRVGWDDEMLAGLIADFFEEPGAFVEKKGAGMGYNVFHSQIDALLERRHRQGRAQ